MTPTPTPELGGGPPQRQGLWWLVLVIIVAVVVGIAYSGARVLLSDPSAVPTSSPPAPTLAPTLAPAPAPAPTPTAPAAEPTPTVPDGAPALVHPAVRGGLLPAGGRGNAYVQTATAVYRLELGTGRITRTPTPVLEEFNSFVAGPGWVVSKSADDGTGVVIRDGQPATPLPSLLQTPGRLHPGPGGRLWLQPEPPRAAADTISLVTIDGRRVPGQTARFDTSDGDYIFPSDGTGYLLKANAGGTYQISAAGARRITRGSPVAVGRRQILVWDCTATARCNPYEVDRTSEKVTIRSKARRPLLTLTDALEAGPNGELSADGRYAALTTQSAAGRSQLQLLDLRTGHLHRIPGATTDSNPNTQLCWTPNGRWLLAITDHQLRAVDARTDEVRTLPLTNEAVLHVTTLGAAGN